MPNPDIRVRLAPEGAEEVIAALRKVQREGVVLGKSGAGGINAITGALSHLKTLLPALGFAGAVAGVVALGRGALNTADELGKMAQRVGTTSEQLSVLDFAAATADVSREQLQKGLIALANNLQKLKGGTIEQIDAFDRLGLSADDFAGKDTVQAFDLVAQRISKIESSITKTQIASDIFGARLGGPFITLLNDVGTKGFSKIREEAEKMGLIFSTDLTKAAERANDSMTLVGKQAQGLATQFVSGFAPSIESSMGLFRKAMEQDGVDAMENFGRAAGDVFSGLVKWFLIAMTAAKGFADLILAKAGRMKETLVDVAKQAGAGGAAGAVVGGAAGSVIPGVGTAFGAGAGAIAGAGAGALRALSTPNAQEEIDIIDKTRVAIAELLEEVDPTKITARAKAMRQLLSGEGSDAQAGLDQKQKIAALEKQLGADQLKQLTALAKQRQELGDQEEASARKRLEAKLAGNADEIANAKALEEFDFASLKRRTAAAAAAFKIDNDIARLREEGLKAIATRQEEDERIRAKLITGITQEANQARLASARTYYTTLHQLEAEYLKRAQDARAKIVQADKNLADATRAIADARSDIQRSGLTAEQQQGLLIADARRKEDELLAEAQRGNQELALKRAAELVQLSKQIASGGDQGVAFRFLDRADEFTQLATAVQKMDLGKTAQEADKGAEAIKKQLDAMKAQLEEFQKAASVEVKVRVSEASLKDLDTSIRDALGRTPFQIAVTPVVGSFARGGAVPGLASGGAVPGISPTRYADNIPILATAGEYMQPVRAVQHYGVDFMEAIRKMELPRFAEGGMVGGASSGTGSGGDHQTFTLKVGRGSAGPFTGSREQIRALVDGLRELESGLA